MVPQQVGSSPRVPGKKFQNRKVCGEVPRCLQVLWKDKRRGRWRRQGSVIFQGCLRPGGMAEPGRGGLGTRGEEVRAGKSPVPHLSPKCCRPVTRGPWGGDCWAWELLAPWAPLWWGPHTRLVSSWAPVLAWGVGSQGHSQAEDRGYCPVTLPAPDIPAPVLLLWLSGTVLAVHRALGSREMPDMQEKRETQHEDEMGRTLVLG